MQDWHLLKIKGSGSLLGHLKKSESEEMTNDFVKNKNPTVNNKPTQLLITAVIEKNNVIDA